MSAHRMTLEWVGIMVVRCVATLVAVAFLSFSAMRTAAAQGVPPAPAPAFPGGGLMKKLQTARILLLASALSLDSSTSAALEAAIDPFDAEMAAVQKNQVALRKQLRTMSTDPTVTASDVTTLFASLSAGRAQMEDIIERRLAAAASVLTPEETAEFAIEFPKVQQALQKEIRGVRHHGPPPAPPVGPAPRPY